MAVNGGGREAGEFGEPGRPPSGHDPQQESDAFVRQESPCGHDIRHVVDVHVGLAHGEREVGVEYGPAEAPHEVFDLGQYDPSAFVHVRQECGEGCHGAEPCPVLARVSPVPVAAEGVERRPDQAFVDGGAPRERFDGVRCVVMRPG
jgi:hypothetical protein